MKPPSGSIKSTFSYSVLAHTPHPERLINPIGEIKSLCLLHIAHMILNRCFVVGFSFLSLLLLRWMNLSHYFQHKNWFLLIFVICLSLKKSSRKVFLTGFLSFIFRVFFWKIFFIEIFPIFVSHKAFAMRRKSFLDLNGEISYFWACGEGLWRVIL